MKRARLLLLPIVLVAVYAVAQSASGAPPGSASLLAGRFGPGPLEGPAFTLGTDGSLEVVRPDGTVLPPVFCAKDIVVNFIVYGPGSMAEPLSNGCWAYNRIVQNAGIGSNTFEICNANGTTTGSGSNKVFDDTNPANSVSTESSRISSCGSTIYAEYMARRTQLGSDSWCSNHSLGTICWRENTGGGSVTRYFAELYSAGETSALDYSSYWPGDGSSGSRPTMDINPDKGNETAIDNDVGWTCDQTANGQYMSIYGSSGLSSTDENYIQGELNSCTIVH